jgi:Sec-independent protein translocase protein TatA
VSRWCCLIGQAVWLVVLLVVVLVFGAATV